MYPVYISDWFIRYNGKMLEHAIDKWLPGPCIDGSGWRLRWRIEEKTKTVFGKTSLQLTALVLLSGMTIAFEEMREALVRSVVSADITGRVRITCRWLVVSPSGGIYLYEALHTPANRRTGSFRSGFVILNSITGVVSFGPGDRRNETASRQFADLIRDMRNYNPERWLALLHRELEVCITGVRV